MKGIESASALTMVFDSPSLFTLLLPSPLFGDMTWHRGFCSSYRLKLLSSFFSSLLFFPASVTLLALAAAFLSSFVWGTEYRYQLSGASSSGQGSSPTPREPSNWRYPLEHVSSRQAEPAVLLPKCRLSPSEQTERNGRLRSTSTATCVCRYALDLIPCLSGQMTCDQLNSTIAFAPFSLYQYLLHPRYLKSRAESRKRGDAKRIVAIWSWSLPRNAQRDVPFQGTIASLNNLRPVLKLWTAYGTE